MKLILLLVAAGLASFGYEKERRLENANADLQTAETKIEHLQQQLAEAKRIQPDFFRYDSTPTSVAAVSPTPAPHSTGQWMWEKRDSPLGAVAAPDVAGNQPQHKGRR